MRKDSSLEEGPQSNTSSQDESHKYMMDVGNNEECDDEQLDRRQIEVIEEMIADEDDHKVVVRETRFIENSQEKSATSRKLSAQLESSLHGSKDKVFGLITGQQDALSQTVTKPNLFVTNKKSEGASTLSKTPPHYIDKEGSYGSNSNLAMHLAAAVYKLSPMLQFKKSQDSRFQFAKSLDPIISGFSSFDWDEIDVPAKIQDMIELNIRTLSNNSLQNTSKGLLLSPTLH